MKSLLLAAALAVSPLPALAMEPMGYIPPDETFISTLLSIEPGERIIATALITTKGAFVVQCFKDWRGRTTDGKPQRVDMLPMQTFFHVFYCGKDAKTYSFALENDDPSKKALVYGLQVNNGPLPR